MKFIFEVGTPCVLIGIHLWLNGFVKSQGIVIAEGIFMTVNILIYFLLLQFIRRYFKRIKSHNDAKGSDRCLHIFNRSFEAYKLYEIFILIVIAMLFAVVGITGVAGKYL